MLLRRTFGRYGANTLLNSRPLPHPQARHGLSPAARGVFPPTSRPPAGRRGIHFIAASVDAAQGLITALHVATGTPWYVTVPLVALIVNTAVRLPFTIYTKRNLRRRAMADRVLAAWGGKHRLDCQKSGMPPAVAQQEALKRYHATANRMHKKLGVQGWRQHATLLALPGWLLVTEALRRMCGAPLGPLGRFLSPEDGSDTASSSGSLSTPVDAAVSPVQDVTSLSAASATSSSGVDLGNVAEVASSAVSNLDQSFATGGCLWFPNLLEADPYYILPATLSVLIIYSIIPKNLQMRRLVFSLGRTEQLGLTLGDPRLQKVMLIRTLTLFGMAMGPLTMDMPATLHLYWISSIAISQCIINGVHKIATMRNPPKPPVQPCKGSLTEIVLPRAQVKQVEKV